ncbi:hypothetical protein niasHT_013476 [Heterodera trifolii]|uniref:WW domain-containing protein n=1 Tax=Heterodera trifolii TaxID=157864 RepID=A0ABD2LCT8_9BILA
MSSLHSYSCWADPRMQKQYEREFVQQFSASKYLYGVSRTKYEDLIKRVGNTFGPSDKIRNVFEVRDCPINGEWVVRLVDKEQKRILLPLEDVFSEIESVHVKGNHKAKTPLHNELKQNYFYPTKPMVEFVVDRCPVCLEKKKKQENKVPDEPIHSNSAPTLESNANFQRKQLNVPQDPITESRKINSAAKTKGSVSVEATAERAFTMIKNLVDSSTSNVPSSSRGPLAPPHCVNSPIPFFEKPLPATAQSKRMPSFLTSTPVNRTNCGMPKLVPPESSPFSPNLSLPNDSRMSVDSNFIHFLNDSNNQPGNQYLSIIREDMTLNNSTTGEMVQGSSKRTEKGTEEVGRGSSGRRNQPNLEEKAPDKSVRPIGGGSNVCQEMPVQIKKEPEDFEFETSFLVDEEIKDKILLALEEEKFGGWRKMRSRSNPTHQYYYNGRTGTSQNELPKSWEKEIQERAKKESNKQCLSSDKANPAQSAHAVASEGIADTTDVNAKKSSEFDGDKKIAEEVCGTLPSEVSVTRPFNDTNDVMNILFPNDGNQEKSANDPSIEYDGMELRDICEQFQQEFADEFQIEAQGIVPLISKDGSQTNGPAETENLNLENIPLAESFPEKDGQTEDKTDNSATGELLKGQNALPKMTDCSNPPNPGDPSLFYRDFVLDSSITQNMEHETTTCSDKIQVLDRRQLEEIIMKKCSIIPSPTLDKPKAVQTARKRSLRPGAAISTAEPSESEESSEDEEEVKRPPPFLVHKMPKCKVLLERIKKKLLQRPRRSQPKKSSENLSSLDYSSQTPNTSRRNTRNSGTPSQLIKQELFLCVKCTRTRTFKGETAYHLHELARHRNCVSANEYVVDYMEKLMPSGLSEVTFCCLLCDKNFDCAEYWEHMSEKHQTKIGARHRRISRSIKDVREGKIQSFNVKKEFLSDSEDEDTKDVTWKGRDGEWAKLEMGRKKRMSRGGAEKKVKLEVMD